MREGPQTVTLKEYWLERQLQINQGSTSSHLSIQESYLPKYYFLLQRRRYFQTILYKFLHKFHHFEYLLTLHSALQQIRYLIFEDLPPSVQRHLHLKRHYNFRSEEHTSELQSRF